MQLKKSDIISIVIPTRGIPGFSTIQVGRDGCLQEYKLLILSFPFSKFSLCLSGAIRESGVLS